MLMMKMSTYRQCDLMTTYNLSNRLYYIMCLYRIIYIAIFYALKNSYITTAGVLVNHFKYNVKKVTDNFLLWSLTMPWICKSRKDKDKISWKINIRRFFFLQNHYWSSNDLRWDCFPSYNFRYNRTNKKISLAFLSQFFI